MSRADQVADALEELMHGRDRRELVEVLELALDRYQLARLYLIATQRLGRSPIRHRGDPELNRSSGQ